MTERRTAEEMAREIIQRWPHARGTRRNAVSDRYEYRAEGDQIWIGPRKVATVAERVSSEFLAGILNEHRRWARMKESIKDAVEASGRICDDVRRLADNLYGVFGD